VLFGFMIGSSRIPHHYQSIDLSPSNQAAVTDIPYAFASFAILVLGMIVAAFYCLGALHSERRDRSILFWKSMPVSNVTAVAAKASVPFIVVPAILFAIIFLTQVLMLGMATIFVAPSGGKLGELWTQWPIFRMAVVLAWALVSLSIWYAPVWGWLLMISAFARRAPFLWAILPPIGVFVVEAIAFGTGHFAHLVGRRLGGGLDTAFSNPGPHAQMVDLAQIDPGQFFSSLDTWGGVAVGLAFLAATVWLRRTRDPV
jgi:ABC-2 type transport system permease protein